MPRSPLQDLDSADVGPVIRTDDPRYEQARQVWNGCVNRRPAAVVRPSSTEQVARALRATVGMGVPLAIRGGGHALPGFGTCDDGVVLDLVNMRDVVIDADHRIATVGGGTTWGDLDRASQQHGLATTGGLVSTTGVAGLTLGGGIGWLTRAHGLACDNLLSVELVTAAGEIVEASHASNPELFWALRGGGGNFGVVTSFRFRLYPVTRVYGGVAMWPIEATAEVGVAYAAWADRLDDAHTTMLGLVTVPDVGDMPADLRGRTAVAVVGCHVGSQADAVEQWQELRALSPSLDHVGDMDYLALQSMFDDDFPAGGRYYFTGGFAHELSQELLAAVSRCHADRPSAGCEIDIHHMGGAAARVSEADSAYAGRNAAYTFNIIAGWENASDDAAHQAWGRASRERLQPFFTDTTYVNFVTDTTEASHIYGTQRYQRLQQVKRAWDPANAFRLNQNITP